LARILMKLAKCHKEYVRKWKCPLLYDTDERLFHDEQRRSGTDTPVQCDTNSNVCFTSPISLPNAEHDE